MKKILSCFICLLLCTCVICAPVFADEAEEMPNGNGYFGTIDDAGIIDLPDKQNIALQTGYIYNQYDYTVCIYTGEFDTPEDFYAYVDTIPADQLMVTEYDSGVVLGTGFIGDSYHYYSLPYGKYSDTIDDAIFSDFIEFDASSKTYVASFEHYVSLVETFLRNQENQSSETSTSTSQETIVPVEPATPLFDAELLDEANIISDKNKDYFERRINAIYETFGYKITLRTKDFNYSQNYPDYEKYSDELQSQAKSETSSTGSVIVFAPHAYKDFYFINAHYGEYRELMQDEMFSFYMIEGYAREDEETLEDMCFYVVDSALTRIENALIEANKPPVKGPEEFIGLGGMIGEFDPMIDAAELFSEKQEQVLFARIEEIHEEYDFDVTLMTLNEIPDDSYDLREYFDWYEGLDPTRDGLVVGVNMDSSYREFSISARNFGMEAFNDDAHWIIDKEVPPLLTAEEYFKAFNLFLDYTEEFLETAKAGDPYKKPIDIYTVIIFVVALPLILASVIAWAIVKFVFVAQMKTAVVQTQAKDFMVKDSLALTVNTDVFTHTTETRVYDPPSDDNESSSGGGSRTTSSGFGGSRSGSSSRF